MAGHSQFKNIMHRKGAQDAKRAKRFTKLIREIMSSAKSGMPDPNFNPRLRAAIAAARNANLPKERIENAIKTATASGNNETYDEIRYEGYAPGGVAIIVEALTDNRNRTASEVRAAFNKYGGTLGETNSVSFMFERIGEIEYPLSAGDEDTVLEAAIEAGAEECNTEEERHNITCQPDSLHEVRDQLSARLGDPDVARLTWKPLNTVAVTQAEQAEKLFKLLEVLEDNDDVQFVCGNYEVAQDILDKMV